jgi:hypothetical protein
MKRIILTIVLITFLLDAFSWGPDVLVGPQATGKATLVSTSNGTLYCSIPAGTTGVGGLWIYTSTDNGATWINSVTIPSLALTKSKLLVTGTDSVYCIYQIGTGLYTYSLASGVSTQFTLMGVDDFDAAASPGSNSIYLFCDDTGNNEIHRYSSTDGGYTWTGSTAFVASNGAHPRIYMSDTRLILNYYSPVLTDTATSVIRSAYYDESGPGNLVAGNFQNLVTNLLHHRQFAPVRSGDNVWLIYTEGDTMQTLNYMLSTDDGASFGSPVTIAGSTNVSVSCFDACHYSDATGSGARLVYYSDSSGIRQMMFRTTFNISTTFSSEEVFNDYTPECFEFGGQPSVAAVGNDVGVIWQEDSSFLATYFDRWQATVGIGAISSKKQFIIYPNPVTDVITLESDSQNDVILLTDISGRELRQINISKGSNRIDLSDLPAGVYYFSGESGLRAKLVKL